ncbi:hypothetical protein J5N97_029902 [Dioscorea zingiberensis]|uniref:Uncharacterized protein n=1 Tax=Dioscorea zingiberensis TaxID=325984 RepID=A0A9D5H3Q9_9LILI|nr:hypothetical protein J5N97_029902 [Dioscorea zingiberensis]
MDAQGTLKTISDDVGVILLADQLREQLTVDIFVESTGTAHGQTLPEVLACGKQDKSLPEVLSTDNNSDEDAEIEEARNKVKRFVKMKKSLQQEVPQHDDQIDEEEATTENNSDESNESGESDESDETNHELDGSNDRPGPKYGKVTGHNKIKCPKRSKVIENTGNVQNDAIPTTNLTNIVSVSQTSHKGKKPAATPKEKAKKPAVAHKGKNKLHASTRGPIQILRGQHKGELIIGREVSHFASLITTEELLARRNNMASAEERRQKQYVNETVSTPLQSLELQKSPPHNRA